MIAVLNLVDYWKAVLNLVDYWKLNLVGSHILLEPCISSETDRCDRVDCDLAGDRLLERSKFSRSELRNLFERATPF